MFDHLYLLAEGQCIYQGNVGGLVPFLSSMGLECPSYHNPADYGKYTRWSSNHYPNPNSKLSLLYVHEILNYDLFRQMNWFKMRVISIFEILNVLQSVMLIVQVFSSRYALIKSYRFSNGSRVRGARRMRSQARDGCE